MVSNAKARRFREAAEWTAARTTARLLKTTTSDLRELIHAGILVRGRHWYKAGKLYWYDIKAIREDRKTWLYGRIAARKDIGKAKFRQGITDSTDYANL